MDPHPDTCHADTPGADALTLVLEGELNIQSAAQHRLALVGALGQATGRDLALDLHAVHSCDSAGIQLLLATRLSLQRAGRRLWLTDTSKTVHDVLRTYGLQALFDRPASPATPA